AVAPLVRSSQPCLGAQEGSPRCHRMPCGGSVPGAARCPLGCRGPARAVARYRHSVGSASYPLPPRPAGRGIRSEALVTERLMPGQPGSQPSSEHVDGLAEALASFPTGVTLVMVADGRDDIGTTVSAFCPASLSPPLVLVSLIADSYPAEVLARVDRFAVTVLSTTQRVLAGRFAVAGRPGARVLLEGT